MKYSAALKFLAIALCAAMLVGVLASGFAIFCLNEAGLYRQSYTDAYDAYRGSILQNAADNIASRYAAQELGGLNDEMIDDYFGGNWHIQQFAFGKMAYLLQDEAGNALQNYTMTGDYPQLQVIKVITAPVEYPKVERTMTMEQWNALNANAAPKAEPYIAMGENSFYDAVPPEGATVTHITVSYGDSSEGVGSPGGLGTIFHNANGHVEFQADMDGVLDVSRRSELTAIRFENEELGLLCEITGPRGVGILYTPEGGYPIFCSNEPNPDYVPEETVTTAPTVETSAPVTSETEPVPMTVGANIYDIPSETGNVVGQITAEDGELTFRAFQVEGRTWLLCEKGWVLTEKALADTATEEKAARGAVQQKTAENQIAFTEDTPVYGMPNLDSDPLGMLTAGMVATPTRTVSVNGETWVLIEAGWLHLPDAAEEEIPQESSEPTQAEFTEYTEAAESTEATETTEPEVPVPAVAEMAPEENGEALPEFELALRYYDRETKQEMMALCIMEEAPAYTVDFTLAPGALDGDYAWSLLRFVNNLRQYLVPVIIGGSLVLAVLAVYLCCAAGHGRGVDGVRPGGLNRLPLDGYFVLLCCTGVGAAFLLMEGVPYLMEGSLEVALFFGGAICYGACVLFVAFCFACAAQFKTPGGYWWRHSLCSWCYRLAVACLTWGIRGLKVLWKWFSAFCQWLARWVDESVFPWAKRSLGALRKILCAVAIVLWQWLRACLRLIKKGLSRLKKGFVRFVGMLPMTWQWLMAGFAIVIVLALTVNTRFGFWGICATIALVLYGAHAFGILLGGVKRMNKGDLDNKVEDKLLVGSFKDFAQELNGLANVAMVAAQKQLKSERMKTELITNVSHDIKTPLTSIINYVDLLEKPHTEQEQTAYLEVLSRQSQRLKKLVDDLMEMSKASTGNMAVDITTVDAVEAVNQALGEFADKLDKAQLIPVFRQPQEQVAMRADGRLVWRILSNLLGNAVKYALPGTRIYLDLNRVGDTVVLSMKNISREELNVSAEELLERFVRGDVSRNTEGSGLGLNIAKSLMELQKGSLNLLVDGDLFKVTLIFPAEG